MFLACQAPLAGPSPPPGPLCTASCSSGMLPTRLLKSCRASARTVVSLRARTGAEGAGPPVQDDGDGALPRWHVGQERAAREDGRGPAVQSHASHLGEAIATAEQRDFAKALELDRPERLAADLRQDVARDLAALGEGDQQHRRVGIARWARNGGVVANRVHGWPSVDAAELVALDPAAHQG